MEENNKDKKQEKAIEKKIEAKEETKEVKESKKTNKNIVEKEQKEKKVVILEKTEDKEKTEGKKVINEEEKEIKDLETKKEESKKTFKVSKVKRNSNKKTIVISVCLIIALILVFFMCTIFALLNINNTNIISNIYVQGINLSGLSLEAAKQKLTEEIEQKISKNINLKAQDFDYQIQLSQIEVNYNIDKALQEAYNIGRNGNIFVNNFDILKSTIKGKNIKLEYTFNEELLNNLINDVNSKIPNAVIEPNYCIENDKLIITKGKQGNIINKEKLKNDIIQNIIDNGLNENIELEITLKEPEKIDIDKIHSEVFTEPKDAYYVKDPFEIFPHINGVDFDLEAARELLKEDKEEYEIKLTITTPKVTTDKIGTEAFPDLLATFSTRYDASNIPRTTNLKLVMKKLDGVMVNPGEVFSYNQTVGKRTAEAGYKEAGGYAAGGVVQTLAGGICQISSTLYDAVVYANLEIVERHNHMFLAGYVGPGKDATVVYGAYDFKFKNTRKYPIVIKTSISGGIAKIDIYGIKEEVEYEVEIATKVLSYTPYSVVYKNDSSLAQGKEIVEQSGMNGCKSITYKVLRLNGAEVSREVLSSDTYDPMNKIIRRGTKKATSSKPKTDTPEKEETTNTDKPKDNAKPNVDDKKDSNKIETEKEQINKENNL